MAHLAILQKLRREILRSDPTFVGAVVFHLCIGLGLLMETLDEATLGSVLVEPTQGMRYCVDMSLLSCPQNEWGVMLQIGGRLTYSELKRGLISGIENSEELGEK